MGGLIGSVKTHRVVKNKTGAGSRKNMGLLSILLLIYVKDPDEEKQSQTLVSL